MKTLIVGGQESFVKSKWKSHLERYGLSLMWHWDYKRKRLPKFPSSAKRMILIKDMCSHSHRDKAVEGAKKLGIPFAEVSRQWAHAFPVLCLQGVINSEIPLTTIKESVEMTTQDEDITPAEISTEELIEYLEIYMGEGHTTYSEILPRLEALIAPKFVEKSILRREVNRLSLLRELEALPPTPPPITPQMQEKIQEVASEVKNWTQDQCVSVGQMLEKAYKHKSVLKGRKKRVVKITNPVKKLLGKWDSRPTEFNAAIITICKRLEINLNSYTLNKAYAGMNGGKKQSGSSATKVANFLEFKFSQEPNFKSLHAMVEQAEERKRLEDFVNDHEDLPEESKVDVALHSKFNLLAAEVHNVRTLLQRLQSEFSSLGSAMAKNTGDISHLETLSEKYVVSMEAVRNLSQGTVNKLQELEAAIKVQKESTSETASVEPTVTISVSKDTFLSLFAKGTKFNIIVGD